MVYTLILTPSPLHPTLTRAPLHSHPHTLTLKPSPLNPDSPWHPLNPHTFTLTPSTYTLTHHHPHAYTFIPSPLQLHPYSFTLAPSLLYFQWYTVTFNEWEQFYCVLFYFIYQVINRPGVAGAVLHTASSFIDSLIQSVSQPFPPDLHNIINHKR